MTFEKMSILPKGVLKMMGFSVLVIQYQNPPPYVTEIVIVGKLLFSANVSLNYFYEL